MRLRRIASSIALLLLFGCEQEQNVPTADEFAAERGKLMERVATRKAKQEKQATAAAAPQPVAPVAAAAGQNLDTFSGSGSGFDYLGAAGRDPFRSFEWERLEVEDSPRGPLEQFDINQLSVVAVVWNTGNGRALIEDPSGQSYIVEKGMRIGKNDGTVIRIDDNLVVVKETYVDFLGHETKKDVEMRIRRSEGG